MSGKVSLPIAPAPSSVVVLAVFFGINLLSLVVDCAASDVARTSFYAAKADSTGFKLFNLAFLAVGALVYSLNAVFALTRPANPGVRRLSDLVGMVIYSSTIFIAMTRILPLERAYLSGIPTDIIFWRRLVLVLQVVQAFQQRTSFRAQKPVAPTKTKNSKKKRQ